VTATAIGTVTAKFLSEAKMDLCNISVIKEVMGEAGITFRKEFGQNFLSTE
jgi:hypothetical protein